jgi:lipoprotein-releasing system permease protein
MRFELFVASRYLRAKRRQAVIGVITGISIAGVAAGVASLVVALAINNGFRQDLQDRLLGSTSHINLLRIQSDGISDWRPLMDRLSKEPHIVAAAPVIYEQVLISRGPRARGAVLKGMIPSEERKVSDLLKSVTIGSADELNQGRITISIHDTGPGSTPAAQSPTDLQGVENRIAAMPPIILGKDMADELGATVGSVVLVTSPQGELTPFGMVPKYDRFRVVGIFDSGFFDYDSSWAFIRLSDAQQLFGLGDLVSVLEFKVDDIYKADQISKEIEQAAGKGFMTTNWMEQNKPLFRALRLERLVTFHHHRADRLRGRAEHSDLAHHDGDGENSRHRRAHFDGHAQIASAPHFHRPGCADWCGRHRDRPGPRLRAVLRRRTLSSAFARSRGLLHRLRALRPARNGRRPGGSGSNRHLS